MARPTNSDRANGDVNSEDADDQAATSERWHAVVSDSGNNLREFPNAQGVYTDYKQKEWTTTVIDGDGDSHDIYTGNVVYAAPNMADHPVPSVEESKEHHMVFDGENRWGLEY